MIAGLAMSNAQRHRQHTSAQTRLSPAWGPASALQERIERELPQMRAVAARADIKVD